MASLKDFIKGWKNLTDLGERVRILDKSEKDPYAFPAIHSDFLEFVRKVYKPKPAQIKLLNPEHPWEKVAGAQDFHYRAVRRVTKTAQEDIADISDDLGEDLEAIAFSVVPIRDDDLSNPSKLDVKKLIGDYDAMAVKKGKELLKIDKTKEPERYESMRELVDEYKAFSNVLGAYKGIVKEVAQYHELRSHLFARDGEPDTKKLKSLIDAHLDKLGKAKNLNGYDRDIIAGARLLASNPRNLGSYYKQMILDPAAEKIRGLVAANKYDLKNYLDSTVKGMNPNSAASFFTGLHAKMAA